MKRILAIILSLLFVFSLTACGSEKDDTAKFVKCFDLKGNLIGSKEYAHSANAKISDGLIICTEYSENGDRVTHLLTPKTEVII